MESSARVYPFIVTLGLNKEQSSYFTTLRKLYFPGHANYLEAHLTLFHHLPSRNDFVTACLQAFSRRPAFDLKVSHLVNFGKGVAFQLQSAELTQLHHDMQQALGPFLKRQDQKPLWPHITIQNKVTAFKAQTTLELLQEDFEPFLISATGLEVWYYIGGPWRPALVLPFGDL